MHRQLLDESIYIDLLMSLAYQSTCLRRQTAALVINGKGSIIGMGFNGAPHGVEDCKTRNECARSGIPRGNGLDQCVAIHAEMRALADVASKGLLIDSECSLWCTDSPCLNCLKLIIAFGITEVYYIREYPIAESQAYDRIKRSVTLTSVKIDRHIKSKTFDLTLD